MMDERTLRQGWVYKQGRILKGWNKRYLTLTNTTLYLRKAPDGDVKSSFNLVKSATLQIDLKCKRQPAFSLTVGGMTLIIHIDSLTEFNSWTILLQRVISGDEESVISSLDAFTSYRSFQKTGTAQIDFVVLKSNGTKMVLKRYPLDKLSKFPKFDEEYKKVEEVVKNESTFVTATRQIFKTESEVVIVYDDASNIGYNIFFQLENDLKFPESRVVIYGVELILALNFLHDFDIIYGQITDESIFLTNAGHIMLLEPGFRNLLEDFSKCTPYSTPEQLRGESLEKSNDIYSLGLILYQMITGLVPFFDPDPETLKRQILNEPIRFPHHVSKQAKELLISLLNRNPKERPSLVEIMNFSFFDGINWESAAVGEITPGWIPIRPDFESSRVSKRILMKSIQATDLCSPDEQ